MVTPFLVRTPGPGDASELSSLTYLDFYGNQLTDSHGICGMHRGYGYATLVMKGQRLLGNQG